MDFRHSPWKTIVPPGSRGSLLVLGLMAVALGCNEGTSRPTGVSDAGRRDGEVVSDSLLSDAQGRTDVERTADLATDALDGPKGGGDADATSGGGDSVPISGRDATLGPDAGTDSTRGAEAGADVSKREDAGTGDAGGGDTGPNIGRDADAQTTGDAGARGSDVDPSGGADADPCAGGTAYADSTTAKATIGDYGWVRLGVSANPIVEFDTTMIVPEAPAASGTLFLWPGLQPLRGGANFAALDNGVLQPVLTWGPTCAPNSPTQSYKSWWISGQYVNTYITSSSANYNQYHDCHGGPGMNVAIGDTLDMRFVLSGTDWTQTVTNRHNGQSVSYTLDMLGQAQASAEFVIEEYNSMPVSDVVFTSSVITFAAPAKSACQPAQRGPNDYFSAPRASADGLRCCIGKIILRADGVAATTPNSP